MNKISFVFVKKIMFSTLIFLFSPMLTAEIEQSLIESLESEWISLDGKNSIVISKNHDISVSLSLSKNKQYNIYIQPANLMKITGKCNPNESKETPSFLFNGILVKMRNACINNDDKTINIYFYPYTNEGSLFVINQFKKSSNVTIEDSGGMFSDIVTANGFSKVYNELNSNKGTYRGL